jgi:TIR domain
MAWFSARQNAEVPTASRIWKDSRIRLFISHVTSSRRDVGELGDVLDRIGFSPFVAHADIEPSREWSSVIEEALSTCDVLVAYLTKDFHASNWTDQEVGWAMGRGALVVPLDVGQTPYGFIARYQAAHGYPSAAWQTAAIVTRAVAVAVFDGQRAIAERLTASMPEVVTRAFELTPSFDMGRFNFELVELVPARLWDNDRLKRLEEAAKTNGQLRECGIVDRGSLPDALQATLLKVRAEGTHPNSTAPEGGPTQSAKAFEDAPILNWQSPIVSVLTDNRIALDVWCSNEGPIGSVARIRRHAAHFHNVGTPPSSGIEMMFEEFEIDTSIYSVHASIGNRLLVKMRSHHLPVRQLGPLQFTWQVAYTDGKFRPYLSEASLVANLPEKAIGRLELADQPALDNTDAATRHERYSAVIRRNPGSPLEIRST